MRREGFHLGIPLTLTDKVIYLFWWWLSDWCLHRLLLLLNSRYKGYPFWCRFSFLVAEQIKKKNGRASPGFDCVAAPFIKHAVVIRLRADGRGNKRVNVLVPYFGRLFELLHGKLVALRPAYLPAGNTLSSLPCTRRGHSLVQTVIACLL